CASASWRCGERFQGSRSPPGRDSVVRRCSLASPCEQRQRGTGRWFRRSQLPQVLRQCGANGWLEEKQTMRLTDPVADMLTRVRNALHARDQTVDIPASRLT